jgi:hypothetical protein
MSVEPNQEQSQQEPQDPAPEAPEQDNPEPSQDLAPSDPESPEVAEEGAEDEGESQEAAQEKSEAAKPEAKRKHKGGWQRQAERAEREAEFLRQQLAAMTGRAPEQQEEKKPELTPEQSAWAEFKAAARQEAKELIEQEKRQAQAEAQQAAFARRVSEAKAEHEDFDEVLADVADIRISPALGQALLTADKPGEIMYSLAKSRTELARISALPPLDAAREIGRLEARLASSTSSLPKPSQAARPPAPPSKVNGSSAPSTRSLETLPISEYKRRMRSGGR